MKKLKLKPPEVEDNATSVLVRIRHQRLASPEEIINEYLQTHDEITNITVRQLTGIGSENQVKRIFQKMIKAGALESVPGRSLRYSAYRLPSTKAGSASDGPGQLQLQDPPV
jgi:ATP-dependent DNA helicase RecG